MKTVILNEVFLAMGFNSRQTHLLPHSNEEDESHFITSVYANSLEKWILMDPDFGVCMTDEQGNILGAVEIRAVDSKDPLVVKNVVNTGQSGLTKAWDNLQNFIDGSDYTWFLSVHLQDSMPAEQYVDQQSKPTGSVQLIPDGYREELLQNQMTKKGRRSFTLTMSTYSAEP
jgi:hypothetical protein